MDGGLEALRAVLSAARALQQRGTLWGAMRVHQMGGAPSYKHGVFRSPRMAVAVQHKLSDKQFDISVNRNEYIGLTLSRTKWGKTWIYRHA